MRKQAARFVLSWIVLGTIIWYAVNAVAPL